MLDTTLNPIHKFHIQYKQSPTSTLTKTLYYLLNLSYLIYIVVQPFNSKSFLFSFKYITFNSLFSNTCGLKFVFVLLLLYTPKSQTFTYTLFMPISHHIQPNYFPHAYLVLILHLNTQAHII
jgi:hypothetical protein